MEFLHESNGFNDTVLKRQYEYFRKTPGELLIGSRVKFMALMPGVVPLNMSSQPSRQQRDWDLSKAPDGISTEKYLDEYLGAVLRSKSADACLQICSMALDLKEAQYNVSIWQNVYEASQDCQQDLYLAPARIVIQRIESAWNLQSLSKSNTSHLTSNRLPSKRTQQDLGILPNGAEQIHTLHWQSDLLTFTNDLDIYVWQPHLAKIPSDYYNSTTVVIPSHANAAQTVSSSAHRLLIVASPPSLMQRFLQTENTFVESSHLWDANHEKLRVFAGLFKWIVDDSSILVDKLISSTREMTFKGRRMPSRSKIQYLVHLDDCRRLAIADLKHAKTVIERARLTVDSKHFCCKETGSPVSDKARASKTFSDFQDDVEFLVGRFEDIGQDITNAREQIKEQMGLAQGQRTLILTIAAAFFIPLSFVASIFGMNVIDPLFPSSTSDSTQLSGPSQHYWTMSSYLEISLPLTAAVILLPLIAGPYYRFTTRRTETSQQQWQAHVLVGLDAGFHVWVLCFSAFLTEVVSCVRWLRWIRAWFAKFWFANSGKQAYAGLYLRDRQVHRRGQV